jgi:hypothetical protein
MDLESLIDEQTFSDSNTGSNSPAKGRYNNTNSGDKNQNEIFTWRVKAGANRIYYLNIKTDRKGDFYLVIKETKHRDDGSKEVHRVMVFEKDLGRFVQGMQKVVEEIEKQGGNITYNNDDDYQGSSSDSVSYNKSNPGSDQGVEENESTKDLPTIEL